MTIREFSEELYISEEEITEVANDVIKTIKEKLPKKYHCECVISSVLSEVSKKVGCATLDL